MSESNNINIGRDDIEVHRSGDPEAPAILYSHGLPSSGKEAFLPLAGVEGRGYQIIAPTRPGFGSSTAIRQKNISNITEDTLRILDKFGIDRVHTVGASAGAKHALALANREPDRVTGASVIAGLPPLEVDQAHKNMAMGIRIGLTAAKTVPDFARSFFEWLAGFKVRSARKNPEGEIRGFLKVLPPTDRAILMQKDIYRQFVDIVRDWSKQGDGKGLFGDIKRAAEPWGFDPLELTTPIQMIHGRKDQIVPWESAEFLLQNKAAHSEIYPGRGHAIYAYPDISATIVSQIQKTLDNSRSGE